MKPLVASLLVVFIVIATVALTTAHHENGRDVPVRALCGMDNSVSALKQLPAGVQVIGRMAAMLNPDADHLTLFRVNHTTQEFFDGLPPASRDKLLGIMIQYLRKPSPDPYTRPAVFWKTVASRARTADSPVCIIFCTDGDDDDYSTQSRNVTRQAALALARNPRVFKVAVIGADPDNWERIRADFAPLGQRLVLSPSTSPDIDGIVRAIDGARDHRHCEEASNR